MTTKTIASVRLALILTVTSAKAEIISVETAAGVIRVSSTLAPKMKAFIADIVANGFRGRIGCYAHGGHVPGSRHYSGNACDFETMRGVYPHPMLRNITAIAQQHGLRDGCSFRDCGHIDDGQQLARGHGRTRLASKGVQHADASFLIDRHGAR